jgi:subtilase family serine protease
VKLGSYGSCAAWAEEMIVDVTAVHLVAPYAKIVITVTPPDTEITEDAASQVAPPEMMAGVEAIARDHLANVISISDGTGESSYSEGDAEITAQDPGELAAAAAGIPLLVATGDCGVVYNLPVASSQCGDTTSTPDTGVWDDSPWVTAVGGSIPVLNDKYRLAGPPRLWHVGPYSPGAGFSAVFARPGYQDGVAHITGGPMRSVPDLTMDSSLGTSLATPLLAGVLALATQENHRNVGPINPVLYDTLGPRGARDGIVDVIGGNNSAQLPDGKIVPGFTAVKGFDVASGWGTIDAALFVPSLVAATKAADQDAAVRQQALGELSRLEHAVTLSPDRIGKGGVSYLLAPGFLPGHPVWLTIDGHQVAKLTAGNLGTVTYMIDPSALHLSAGWHAVRLTSMLLTETGTFRSS